MFVRERGFLEIEVMIFGCNPIKGRAIEDVFIFFMSIPSRMQVIFNPLQHIFDLEL